MSDLPESNSRRRRIEAMLADEPGDVFLRYSLAMELAKEEHHAESQALFKELRSESPPYLPAFFMAAQKLAEIDRAADAKTILEEGIAEASRQGDAHAEGEMREFLRGLLTGLGD